MFALSAQRQMDRMRNVCHFLRAQEASTPASLSVRTTDLAEVWHDPSHDSKYVKTRLEVKHREHGGLYIYGGE